MDNKTHEKDKSSAPNSNVNFLVIGLLIVALLALAVLYKRVKKAEQVKTSIAKTVETAPQPTKPVEVAISDEDPSKGPKDATIVIVEFSDFQCPFCGGYAGLDDNVIEAMKKRDSTWEPVEPNVIRDYVNTGKARFVWKDYPFLGEESKWAAQAARCAHEQGKFWEYHDFLFSNRNGENKGDFSKDNLKKYAQELGINSQEFNECLDSDRYAQKVSDALTYGQSLGIKGTPATFINNKLISGAVPYSAVKKIIDEMTGL